jgi:outer membrane protein OmpA-like peptidoglycan-associated protein
LTTTPVPMTFVYNEATLTPEGREAARLLLEYLTLKKFGSVTLTGHADERGLPDYNMELSRQRLISIEHLLRDGGYQGKLDLLPKGATEPFMGVDRSRYPREELLQLDRRVELRVAN